MHQRTNLKENEELKIKNQMKYNYKNLIQK